MKKIIYFLSSLMVILSACDPMDDTYEELDALPRTDLRSVDLTLTKADYESLKGKPGVPSYVNTSLYFTSEEEAGNIIPLYLNTAYAQLEEGDAIDVTYNLLVAELRSSVAERVSYTLTERADYALGGTNFSNFDSWAQIETFLKAKYPSAVDGTLVTLTFTWYNANAAYPNPELNADGTPKSPTQSKTVTDSYFYSGGRWFDTYSVTNADYLSVERNRNNAFTSGDETSQVPLFLNKFLKENIIGAEAGDIQYASYYVRYSSSSTLLQVTPMIYDGVNWTKAPAAVTTPATLTFSMQDGVWVPDLTIRYTMVEADYIWISTQPSLGTEAQRTNLADFGNFYQSFAGNNYNWSDANVFTALAGFLKYKFPDAEVGQKVSVTYAYYASGAKVNTVTFQKQASGEFTVMQ